MLSLVTNLVGLSGNVEAIFNFSLILNIAVVGIKILNRERFDLNRERPDLGASIYILKFNLRGIASALFQRTVTFHLKKGHHFLLDPESWSSRKKIRSRFRSRA